MNPDEFRRHGHIRVDWMADYLAGVAELPITPDVAPGQVRRAIPAAPPSAGEPFEALFRNFRELIVLHARNVEWGSQIWTIEARSKRRGSAMNQKALPSCSSCPSCFNLSASAPQAATHCRAGCAGRAR
jgi:hypothetical protein